MIEPALVGEVPFPRHWFGFWVCLFEGTPFGVV